LGESFSTSIIIKDIPEEEILIIPKPINKVPGSMPKMIFEFVFN
jgi:hypothetical protein